MTADADLVIPSGKGSISLLVLPVSDLLLIEMSSGFAGV